MKLVNLTPHALNLHHPSVPGSVLMVPPSGTVARCREVVQPRGTIEVDGYTVTLVAKTFGQIENLPDPEDGVIYVTSALAAQAAWAIGRRDVVCPGDPVRDSDGRVVGATSLCVAP